MGNLLNLEMLLLGSNQLSGEVPPELGSLASLERLELRRNQLSGCIPSGLRYVPQNDFSDMRLSFCE